MIILGQHVRMIIKKKMNRDTLNSKFSTNLSLFLIGLFEGSALIYLKMSHLSEVDLIDFKCEEEVKIFGTKWRVNNQKIYY